VYFPHMFQYRDAEDSVVSPAFLNDTRIA